MRKFYLVVTLFIAVLASLSSCQKDGDIKDSAELKSTLTDSALAVATGNSLALTGTLSIKVQDSTYVFDAARDSIAFINVHDDNDDKSRYFGFTAINKEHTMSFGISSPGYVHDNKDGVIAGSQFILNPEDKTNGLLFSLSRYAGQKDFGKIRIEKYNRDSVLAKGTFSTYFAKDDMANSPVYKAEGTFNLRLQ